jgi:hypothetical protein
VDVEDRLPITEKYPGTYPNLGSSSSKREPRSALLFLTRPEADRFTAMPKTRQVVPRFASIASLLAHLYAQAPTRSPRRNGLLSTHRWGRWIRLPVPTPAKVLSAGQSGCRHDNRSPYGQVEIATIPWSTPTAIPLEVGP